MRLLEALEGEEETGEEVDAGVDVPEEAELEEGDEPMEDDAQDSAVGTSQADIEGSDNETAEAETLAQTEEPEEEAAEAIEEDESKAPDSSCDIEGEGEASEDYVVVSKPTEEESEEVEKAA